MKEYYHLAEETKEVKHVGRILYRITHPCVNPTTDTLHYNLLLAYPSSIHKGDCSRMDWSISQFFYG